MSENSTQYNWTRINNDVNGNPRYVVHFLQCVPASWQHLDLIDNRKYEKTIKLMNKLGGKKFHNKQYGGGIVFQSYSLPELEGCIDKLKSEVTEREEYQGWTNSATWSAAYLVGNESSIYARFVAERKAGKRVYGGDVKQAFRAANLHIDDWCEGVINWQEIADHHYNDNEYN